MTRRDDYSQRVGQLDQTAKRNPTAYLFKVFLLALLGIGYITFMLLLAIALSIGLIAGAILSKNIVLIKVAFKFAWIPLGFAWIILKAMWFKFPAPQGTVITRKDAPRFFETLDQMRRQLNALPVHQVLVTDDFNAAVTQIPRLGALGWPRNILMLGLPLMGALAPDEFRSVLAHELGHLSRNHGRFGNWVYRIRRTWDQLLHSLEQKQTFGAAVFTKFFAWYAPYFDAYTFALARQNEYEADRISSELTSPTTAAQALVNVNALGYFAEEKYWRSVFDNVESSPEPPQHAFTGQLIALKKVDRDVSNSALDEALARKTGAHNTHPSLSDRLNALGQPALAPTVAPTSAAEHFLGPLAEKIASDHDAKWRENIAEQWTSRHAYLAQCKLDAADFAEKSANGTITVDELWSYACIENELKHREHSIELINVILKREATHGEANLAYGRMLLSRSDNAGIEHLKLAEQSDPELKESVAETLSDYFHHAGEPERAAPYDEHLARLAKDRSAAQKERSVMTAKDTFESHGFSEDEIAIWRAAFAKTGVKKAWLAKKAVKHFPEHSAYVLILTKKGLWGANAKFLQMAIDAVPNVTIVAYTANDNKKLYRKVKKAPGSLIFKN